MDKVKESDEAHVMDKDIVNFNVISLAQYRICFAPDLPTKD